jgi:uncharacterized membrane protein YbaN (DUF454 family)
MRTVKRVFNISFGVIFLLIGTAGIVLPLLNGLVFLLLGLIILSFESEKIEMFLQKITNKNKQAHYWHSKISSFLGKWLK